MPQCPQKSQHCSAGNLFWPVSSSVDKSFVMFPVLPAAARLSLLTLFFLCYAVFQDTTILFRNIFVLHRVQIGWSFSSSRNTNYYNRNGLSAGFIALLNRSLYLDPYLSRALLGVWNGALLNPACFRSPRGKLWVEWHLFERNSIKREAKIKRSGKLLRLQLTWWATPRLWQDDRSRAPMWLEKLWKCWMFLQQANLLIRT